MDIESKVSQMLTKQPKRKDREVEWVWQSPTHDIEVLDHTGEPVGVRIEMSIEHDKKRKEFRATMRKVHWKYSDTPGISITFFSPFDHANYPSVTIARFPVARYSATALEFFEEMVTQSLVEACEKSTALAEMVDAASSYA
jgi:hypothetical protein